MATIIGLNFFSSSGSRSINSCSCLDAYPKIKLRMPWYLHHRTHTDLGKPPNTAEIKVFTFSQECDSVQ